VKLSAAAPAFLQISNVDTRPVVGCLGKESAIVKWPLVLLVAVLVSVVWIGSAFGSFKPSLSVSLHGSALVTEYSTGSSDDALGRLFLLVPPEYLVQTGLLENQTIGKVSGQIGGSKESGTITAALATTSVTVAGTATTMAALMPGCTGNPIASIVQYSILHLGSLAVPLFLVDIQPTDLYGDVAFYAMKACLPAGSGVTSLSMSFDNVWSVPPGWYLWRALATPFSGSSLNTNGTVEAQSIDRVPRTLTLLAKDGDRLSGQLSEGGKGIGGQTIEIMAHSKVVATAKTNGSGRFAVKASASANVTVTASATVAAKSGPCVALESFAASCTSNTFSGFSVSSEPVKVK
jgi:hypothetical protein